jgi:hypothetical protein
MFMKRYVVLLFVVLGLAACGTPAPVSRMPDRTLPEQTCPSPSARHAWVTSISGSGHVLWQASLTTRENSVSSAVAPVVAGSAVVVAQDGIVHGLALGTGRTLWNWTGGQDVYAMWRWDGAVAVLTDQVSASARITSLDAATGAVRWWRRMPAGLYGNQAVTGDGGVAVISDGTLQVIDLSSGRIRWSVRTGNFPQPVVAGGVVAAGVNTTVSGYSVSSGAGVWTVRGLPAQPLLVPGAGLVLVGSQTQGGTGDPTAITAIDPRAGRVAWRFDAGTTASVLSAGASGILMATYNPRRLYLVSTASGRPRWSAPTFVEQDFVPLLTGSGVVTVEGSVTPRLVDRSFANGSARWSAALPGSGPWQVTAAVGGVVVPVNSDRPDGQGSVTSFEASTGREIWTVKVPTFVQAPVVSAGGETIVQTADAASACAAVGSAVG